MNEPQISVEQLIGWEHLFTDEERMVRQSVTRFVRERCMPRVVEDFEAGRFPTEIIPELADLGVFGGNLEGYGCPGMSNVAYGLACHELEACDSGLRSFVSVQTSLAMYAVHRFGSEEQKRRWLPEMAQGKLIGCFGLTEPDHGSDPGGMKTRAQRDGAGWVLTGTKMWITNAQIADLSVVWAKTGPGPESIAGFVVERGARGFSATDIPHKLSMRASATGGLVLDEVRLGEANRLPGAQGLGAPLSCLNNARFGVAWGVLGAGRFCLEQAIAYSRQREQFGAPIGSKQLIQAQLADMANEVVKASLLSVHCGRLKDEGRLHPAQVSLFKRNNCRIALDCARTARSILGANGVTTEYHALRHALNLESTYTYEGTDEIHALIVGRALTGLDGF
jgi:glutaryl-CoA dehydrogenase